MMQPPKFGDKNTLKFIQNSNLFSKKYSLSNGSSIDVIVKFNEVRQIYLIEVTNVKGSFKEFRFLDVPKSLIISKKTDHLFECMVLYNFGTSFRKDIILHFVVFFSLKRNPSICSYNMVFTHGLYRSFSFDEYLQFYIQESRKEKTHCVIRKIFDLKSDKASYYVYFNWNNKSDDNRSQEFINLQTAKEKFLIVVKQPRTQMETEYLNMLQESIKKNADRRNSAT